MEFPTEVETMAEYTKTFTICDNCGKNTEENPNMEWQCLKREGANGDYCSEKCVEEHWEAIHEKHQDEETSIPPSTEDAGYP